MAAFGSLLSELKRRHVYRVAVVYAAVGWLLVQIITQVFPVFSISLWAQQVAVLVVLSGFPVALIWAWGREVALRRARDAGALPGSPKHRRVDVFVLLLAILAIGLIAALWSAQRVLLRSPDVASESVPNASGGIKSIAVLPFENLSSDHDNAYFAAGMQEQVLTQLTGLSGLKTISRTSTAKYASHPEDVKAIGLELGVDNILEGSVQKEGDEARISLQLIDTRTDAQLWAQNYDRNLSNIFTVESEVAGQVASALRVALLPKEKRELEQVPTRDAFAYDAYLRGVDAQQRADVSWKQADIDAAIAAFKQATSADPQFALAFARLGYAYAWTLNYVADVDQKAMEESSRVAFGRALALDPDLPEAHVAAGFYHLYGEGDYAAAAEQFKEALTANPQNAEAQLALADVEHDLGHLDDAEFAFRRAISLDPRNVLAWQGLAWVQGDRHRYAQADDNLVKALAINYHAGLTWGMRNVLNYPATGSGARMLALINSAPVDVQANPNHLLDRSNALYRSHDYAAALKLVVDSKGAIYSAVPMCRRRADIEWAAGQVDTAKDEYRSCVKMVLADASHEEDAGLCAMLGWFYAHLGQTDDAVREGERAVRMEPISKSWEYGAQMLDTLALIEAQLGRTDKAVPLLDQLLSNDHGTLVSINTVRSDVEWDPIRDTPEFKQLLQRHALQ